MFPVRCFACHKILGNKCERFYELQSCGLEVKEIYEKMGIKRFCCKSILLTTSKLIDRILDFKTSDKEKLSINIIETRTSTKSYCIAR